MNVFAGLLSLAGLSLFLARALRRSSALMPVLAICVAMLYFALAGVAGVMMIAGWLWYALCLAALVAVVVLEKGKILRLLSPGLCYFVVGGAAFILLFHFTRPMLTQWDEFTFWGTAAKVTANSGQLYTVARSSLIARSYPPGLIVYSAMMQFFGGFSEAGFMACFAVFYLACFSAASAAFGKGRGAAALLFLAGMTVLPLFFEQGGAGRMMRSYVSCMADLPMALLFGAALCFYYGGEEKDARLWLPFGLILAGLVNLKDMGFALALVALAVALLDAAFCERERLRFLRLRRWGALGLMALYGLIMAAGMYLVWWAHLRALPQAVNRFNIGAGGEELDQFEMLLAGVRMLFGAEAPSEQFAQVRSDMLNALFARPVSLIGSGAAVLVLICLLTALALLLAATRRQTRRVAVFGVFMLLGFAAFYIFNIFTYAFVFRPVEAETLREYERYINPYWMAWLMGTLTLLSRTATTHKATFHRLRMARGATGLAAAGLLAVVMLRGNWQANFTAISPALYTERQNVLGVATAARDEGMRPEDDIYIISQGDDGTRFYMFGFELSGVRTQIFNGVFRDEMGEAVLDEDGGMILYRNVAATLIAPDKQPASPYDLACTPEELTAFFRQEGNTHVLVDVADAYILEAFAPMFSDSLAGWGPLTRGHSYYRIVWNEAGGCTLVPEEGGAAA